MVSENAELEYNGGCAEYEDIADYKQYTPIYGRVIA
jgi:hypothetical protein